MDAALTHWINSIAGTNALLDGVMVASTQFGVPLLVGLVVLQWWGSQDRAHLRHAAISAGLSFLLALAINQGILLFVHRPRPYDAGLTHLLIASSADWSFPSDHATAVAAIVATFAMQRLPGRALAFGGLATLVCVSRVFVGTHYVTDILGGIATGILATVAVRWVYREGNPIDRQLIRIF